MEVKGKSSSREEGQTVAVALGKNEQTGLRTGWMLQWGVEGDPPGVRFEQPGWMKVLVSRWACGDS